MKRLSLLYILVLMSAALSHAQIPYAIPVEPWPESFGNHRAVLDVRQGAPAVSLDFLWRRHDPDPQAKRFIIVHAQSGDTIQNIKRIEVNNERSRLVFGPAKKGTYYFYYLPYEVQKGHGFYNKGYLEPEKEPDKSWIEANGLSQPSEVGSLPQAKVTAIQSRLPFDSFYPMEVIPTSAEKTRFLASDNKPYYLFPESRTNPIRMKDEVPLKWIVEGESDHFLGEAMRHEYYAFQIGLWAAKTDVKDVKVSFSNLEGPNGASISADRFTCFNTGGIDPYGKPFVKKVDVEKGYVQPFWIGVDVDRNAVPGRYTGTVTLTPANAGPRDIKLTLEVNEAVIEARGDNEPWRHSRLRWLNSTVGINNKPVAPYHNIEELTDNRFSILGRQIGFGANGLPRSIKAWDKEILEAPVYFTVETASGTEKFMTEQTGELLDNGLLASKNAWAGQNMNVEVSHTLEFDGYLHYKLSIHAREEMQLEDVRLGMPLKSDIAQYMKMMGDAGREVPASFNTAWDGPWDSFWIGNQQGGIWCELRGGDYHGPLLNLYKPAYPESWNNNGKGGIRVTRKSDQVSVEAYTGQRVLKAGDTIDFEFALLVTPVKPVDYESQFTDRYYHRGDKPRPSKEDFEAGVKIINVHHANEYNPYINYPFLSVEALRGFVDEMHIKGRKVKIYYTVRELTNYTTELWALRSLGHEILGDGRGGGYPWLREHLVEGYRPQWYQHFDESPDLSPDASIVNAPGDSRWLNYYIEGLGWLIRNIDIDGLYLDDVTYDRRILKRMRRVMEQEKPGSIIDLHSNTGFSKGPVTQYAEFFPYIDKLWFGESFQYDKMPPANWLVEVSGIPFGLMGDMLHAGGNRWLGMLFGMTVRHPWLTEGVTCDPRPVWKVWDEFGIQNARMIGFWEPSPVVTTDSEDVKATAYVKDGKTLVALGNFSDIKKSVKLNIDWQKLSVDQSGAVLHAPYIKDFQEEKNFKPSDEIDISARKGWLLILK